MAHQHVDKNLESADTSLVTNKSYKIKVNFKTRSQKD